MKKSTRVHEVGKSSQLSPNDKIKVQASDPKKKTETVLKKNELTTSAITYSKRDESKPRVSKAVVGDHRIKKPSNVVKKSNVNNGLFQFFKTTFIPSDIILYIFDFYGGDFMESATSERGTFNLKKFMRIWYGRFKVDSQVKFLFRYGIVDAKILSVYGHSELLLLLRHQFITNNEMLEKRLIHKLCECKSDSQSQKEAIRRLVKVKLHHSDLCKMFTRLNLIGVKSASSVLEKAFEIFSNIEVLKIGSYPPFPAKNTTTKPIELPFTSENIGNLLSKTNKKVKEVFIVADVPIISKDFIDNTPLLESFQIEGSISSKYINNLNNWKNLKSFKACFNDYIWIQQEQYDNFEFFRSMSKCNNLTSLILENECVTSAEFKELFNKLPNLTELKLSQIEADEEMFKTISSFNNLKCLSTNWNTKEAVPLISSLGQLERIQIANVTDSNISFICNLPHVKELEIIYSPDVSDVGAIELTKLKDVEIVRFDGYLCTHHVVEEICKSCPKLKKVAISLSVEEREKIPTHILEKYYKW